MQEIWKNLPLELVHEILKWTDIDTRLALGVLPGRIKIPALVWPPVNELVVRLSNGFLCKGYDNWTEQWFHVHKIWRRGREITYRRIGDTTFFSDSPFINLEPD